MTNGTRIVVPEGYGLLLLQDGKVAGFVGEPGRYTWSSGDPQARSIFAGDTVTSSLILQSWERFKFGGTPAAQQIALFVRLAELPNNRFGTKSPVYWDDGFLNTQVGAVTHGTYSISIVDPILFAAAFVPSTYLQGLNEFDFTDVQNPAAGQLLNEVVGSLAAAFSLYANSSDKLNRISRIQQDSIGFTRSLAQAVDDAYEWRTTRGLAISKVAIVGIEYDDHTRELLKTVQRADALQGFRGNVNLQASVAEGIQAAGSTGGSDGIIGLGIAAGSIGLAGLGQQVNPNPTPTAGRSDSGDLLADLAGLKEALDAGLIDQVDYDAAKRKLLGLD